MNPENISKPKIEDSKSEPISKSVWNTNSLRWLKYIAILTAITRFILIQFPPGTVFDERHHARFITWHVRRQHYLDVHPPLGRLIFGITAELFGYDGSLDFVKSNPSFEGTSFPYVAIRSVSALFSVLISVLAYATLIEMKFSLQASVAGAFMIVFDHSLTLFGRIFVLESPLVCFILFTCFSWVKFRSCRQVPFSMPWWSWLVATGLGIGLSVGVKFVGLFIMASIGVATIYDLWDVCRVEKTPSDLTALKHFLARAFCLIALPAVCFIGFYWVHFQFMYKSGPADEYMSTNFQLLLEGNRITNGIFPVFYGSKLSIKSKVEPIYLHSHDHRYPRIYENKRVSSSGQQVTGYGFKDENNTWLILPANPDIQENYTQARIPVVAGDFIRLMHVETKKFLITHNVASPLTKTNQEVTAVDWNGNLSEPNAATTIWQLNILESTTVPEKDTNVLTSKLHFFQLVHNETNSSLLNYPANLPDWGYNQGEINAAKTSTPNSLWLVEDVEPANGWSQLELDDAKNKDYFSHVKMSFWEKFLEMIQVSLKYNSRLTDPHSRALDPLKWPVMTKGMNFWFSPDHRKHIYLIGNPFCWFISLLSLVLFAVLLVVDLVASRRGKCFLSCEEKSFVYSKGCFFFLCYLVHYLPFFVMTRILYFHHYVPCYVFSCLVFAATFQVLMMRFRMLSKDGVVALLGVCAAAVFWKFSALIYGTEHSREYFLSLKWKDGWDFVN